MDKRYDYFRTISFPNHFTDILAAVPSDFISSNILFTSFKSSVSDFLNPTTYNPFVKGIFQELQKESCFQLYNIEQKHHL